jgi:hypothetical protein
VRADNNDDASSRDPDDRDTQVAVGARVRVLPGDSTGGFGVVIEDFGERSGVDARTGADQIALAPRRWAVVLDDGGLVFANSDQITVD